MNKTIIAVYGVAGRGKSESVKLVSDLLQTLFPTAKLLFNFHPNTYDVCVIIELNGIRIGIESMGDPNSRMLYEKPVILEDGSEHPTGDGTVEKLALYGCDVIVCTTRTEGATEKKVEKVANGYDYFTLWKSSNYSPNLDHKVLNRFLAEEIINIIKALIVGQL